MNIIEYFQSLNPLRLLGNLPGGIAQGIIWGIMALGVYITFRLLDVADLSVDGTFSTGGAVTVMLILSGRPAWVAVLVAILAGLLAGTVTGLLHTKLGIPVILAGILTQFSLYSINLHIMGMAANKAVSVDKYKLLLSSRHIPAAILTGGIIAVVLVCIFYWYFGTEQGSAMRATGANPAMCRALGINILKLESRPIPHRDFEFMFYFDIECPAAAPEFSRLMDSLSEVCEEFRTGVALGNRKQRHRGGFNRTVHLVLANSLVADISDDIVLGRFTGKHLTYLIKRFGKKFPLLFVVANGIEVHHLTAEILRQGFTGRAVLLLAFVGGCFPLLTEGFGKVADTGVVGHFSLRVALYSGAGSKTLKNKHAGGCTADTAHPANATAKRGGEAESQFFVHPEKRGTCRDNRLRAVETTAEIVLRTLRKDFDLFGRQICIHITQVLFRYVFLPSFCRPFAVFLP